MDYNCLESLNALILRSLRVEQELQLLRGVDSEQHHLELKFAWREKVLYMVDLIEELSWWI